MEKARSQPLNRTTTVDVRDLPLSESAAVPRPPSPDRLPSERIRDALRRWVEQEL